MQALWQAVRAYRDGPAILLLSAVLYRCDERTHAQAPGLAAGRAREGLPGLFLPIFEPKGASKILRPVVLRLRAKPAEHRPARAQDAQAAAG